VTIAKGMLSQDFTLVLLESKRPINLTGTVNLATRQLVDTTLILPWSLFALKDKSLESLMPEGVKIPMKGQSNSPIPALDFNQLIQQNAGNTLQKLLQGGNKNNNQPGNQPNGQQDPLKALTDLLNKNKNNQQQQPQQQPMPQQQAPANQDPAKALEDLVNGNKNPPPATSQPAQQQQEDPVKALTDLFKKKKK
jgi:hypothetical protein